MSGAPDPKRDDVHPFARPFLWLDKPWARRAPLYIFGALAAIGLVMEYLVPRHAVGKWEQVFGFYEIEGFFGFCLAVLAGWPLRWLLARPADYWERGGDDDA
ncbi:hypothetical protein DDZ18_09870 [Marinicauda salina]|uniref:Uncharacterized protein n=1 Tax=Marinicauda salina TaxID=2135793 RepID=A0A2U2BSN4_9PROT|nr:hypothetical protein [Marinicauda salina]PWE17002.1 hypothetical protein DDZ18_09870 [Marinicauda salina]